jgi:hypothetical protein
VIFAVRGRIRALPPDDVILVGGYDNIALCGGRRVVYVEHGAGQTYSRLRSRSRPHYPGGPHPPNVIGYICPNRHVAALWDRPTVVVGCPALEGLQRNPMAVVFTFHWDAPTVCPEARSARPHYLDHLHEMVQWVRDTGLGGLHPLGHWHPRDRQAETLWRRLGVECEPDPDRALERARLVVADNTSFAYEAALLGIANVALNAPWYRRDVEHGLRFWKHPPGIMVDDADELMSRPVHYYALDKQNHKLRRAAARRAYGLPLGGGGAKAGAEFIEQLVS